MIFSDNTSSTVNILSIDDNRLLMRVFKEVFIRNNISLADFDNDNSAIEYIHKSTSYDFPIDCITTDLMHLDMGGMGFIRYIRNLPNDVFFKCGLRIKHTPIVVFSAVLDSEKIGFIDKIDKDIIKIQKPAKIDGFLSAIDNVIKKYRSNIIEELNYIGLSITWNGMRFVVNPCFYRQNMQSKYFHDIDRSASNVYSRLVLISDRLESAERSLDELEFILNSKHAKERDLHEFFCRNPEFLYRNKHGSHWSEPNISSNNRIYRPDFIMKPLGNYDNPWEWEIVELKRHNVNILTKHRNHSDFTSSVYHGCEQLRSYSKFFDDPRNHEALMQRFNGIIPRPKLTLVIGRLHQRDFLHFGELRKNVPDVTILTYDDILNFRKSNVQMRKHLWR